MGMNDQMLLNSGPAGMDRNQRLSTQPKGAKNPVETYTPDLFKGILSGSGEKTYGPGVESLTRDALNSTDMNAKSQSSYFKFKGNDGEDLWYMQDPMKFVNNVRGSSEYREVPNLYLAYKNNLDGADAYVKQAKDYFPTKLNQQVSKTSGSGRSSVNYDQNTDLVPDGYVFSVDPWSYGAQQYTKERANKWDSFAKGMASLLGVVAAPLTAGLTSLYAPAIGQGVAGLTAQQTAQLAAATTVGGLQGAMSDNPLQGAAIGALGAGGAPVGLNYAGVTNPIAQGALIGGGTNALLGEDPLMGAGMGALSGGKQMLESGDLMENVFSSLSGGGSNTGLKMDSGFGSNLNFGGSSGGGTGGGFDFMDKLNLSSAGSGLGLKGPSNMSGGFNFGGAMPGLGLKMPGGDWYSGKQMPGSTGLKIPEQQFGGIGSAPTGGINWQGVGEAAKGLGMMADKLPLKEIINGIMNKKALDNYSESQERIAREASARADPAAGQRAQYQAQLAALMGNPNSFLDQDTLYQTQKESGEDAIKRMNSARGYYDSGNEMHDLYRGTSDLTRQTLNDRIAQLSQLGGFQFGPGQSGQLYAGGMGNSAMAQMKMQQENQAMLASVIDAIMASQGRKSRDMYSFA